ncbi:DUF72 domain-containing protein [Methyloceanibacter sp.]|uniref:DUF72 domain-containing protein n=1 Tax=Methyloceanibacter sp. TaxID=1965321 RepID=UPI002D41109C|nr:DUF72 domain-containing protein [Methyloceanibacter sp.]HZP08161.1 DUF72 domain-containing protein [Methyloceanibacter sp.]
MAEYTQAKTNTSSGKIRVGIGGWIYAPWRGTFYPKGLKQADELAYAASRLTSIEINATHYRLQSPASFRKWAAAAPDGFKFSVKGPRLVTQQKVLAETGAFIKRFLASGLAELGDKLGPVLWQFAPFKKFDKDDFARFLDHLPRELDGQALHHVVEPRHASFATPEFVRLLRDCGVGAVFTEAEDFPSIADITSDVVYARLQRGDDTLPAAYPPAELDRWAARARLWAAGTSPDDLPLVDAAHQPAAKPRNVFIYFIHEGKLRAPAAAMALIERLG